MELKLIRTTKTKLSTIGELYVDGVFQCYTLEDVERAPGVKIQNETAIPKGTYQVIINDSVRFKRKLPLLLDVPNFKGVRIHSGNTNHDTEGCILVGTTKGNDFIGNSRAAFAKLFAKMQQATIITLTIS